MHQHHPLVLNDAEPESQQSNDCATRTILTFCSTTLGLGVGSLASYNLPVATPMTWWLGPATGGLLGFTIALLAQLVECCQQQINAPAATPLLKQYHLEEGVAFPKAVKGFPATESPPVLPRPC